MEKGSELAAGDPQRKFKGRVVFLGDRVRDAAGHAAAFEELSSSPASMEASKWCDAYGLLPGHKLEGSDGTAAYTQAKLKGTKKTWIRIPKHRWPESWKGKGYLDPVCRLERALYGHPDAGGHWEKHCEEQVDMCGFKQIGTCFEWRSVFWNTKLKVMLSIYVDDFKLAGPVAGVDEAWKLLQGK